MKSFIQSRYPLALLLAAAATTLAIQHADATLLFADGLNYTAGSLGPANTSPAGLSGNAWVGGSSHITVVSSDLTYAGMSDLGANALQDVWGVSAGSVLNTYTAQTSGSIFYSFLLDATVAPSGTQYLTALNPGTGAPNGSGDALQVDVGPGAGGGYEVGLRTAGASITLDTTVLSLNTTYMVVAEYTFGTLGSASLYLDPVAGAAQPGTAAVTLAGNGSVTSIADIGFKAQSSSTTGTFLMDDLLVGTTWADVTSPVPVPEPSSPVLALAGLGALMTVAGFRRARRCA